MNYNKSLIATMNNGYYTTDYTSTIPGIPDYIKEYNAGKMSSDELSYELTDYTGNLWASGANLIAEGDNTTGLNSSMFYVIDQNGNYNEYDSIDSAIIDNKI